MSNDDWEEMVDLIESLTLALSYAIEGVITSDEIQILQSGKDFIKKIDRQCEESMRKLNGGENA